MTTARTKPGGGSGAAPGGKHSLEPTGKEPRS